MVYKFFEYLSVSEINFNLGVNKYYSNIALPTYFFPGDIFLYILVSSVVLIDTLIEYFLGTSNNLER